jgi:hypothetical protein
MSRELTLTEELSQILTKPEAPNVRVDAAARIHSSIAGPIKLRNTLPALASNDLFGDIR